MDIHERAARVKLLILDVDGVMTDGRILMDDRGQEIKCFHVRDGLGLKLLMEAGIEVAMVSSRYAKAVELRAKDLGIQDVFQGVQDKEATCLELMRKKNLDKMEICSMGDDLQDIPMFRLAGVSVAVADAPSEVKGAASFVTEQEGGKGAVREVCEWLLKTQKKWPDVTDPFQG